MFLLFLPIPRVPIVPPVLPISQYFPLSTSTSIDPPPPQSTSDLDLPIAIRKVKRTCTDYPISNFVSFDRLTPSFKALTLSVSSLVVSKSYREALSHPGWHKLNRILDGTSDRLKARLVAKGFIQTYGLDSTETFSLVAKLNFIRIIISLAANLDWPLEQHDVKNTFLHGDLTEIVYMAQLPGKAIVFHGMTRSQTDHFVLLKKTRIGIVILVVYVDDIVITGSNKEGIQILINHLSSSFLTKDLGKLCYFLGG
uniref:Reverse transcriptase Ty1/copia-type domain-containing protein n=1 Tax=Fagus sylvatica TaxID=28930 RepID=A0A2N9GV59_FAGSY